MLFLKNSRKNPSILKNFRRLFGYAQIINTTNFSFECSRNQTELPYLSFVKINNKFPALCASIKNKSFEFIPFTSEFKPKIGDEVQIEKSDFNISINSNQIMNSFYEGESGLNTSEIKSISKFPMKHPRKCTNSNQIIFTSNYIIDLCYPIIDGSLNMIYEKSKESPSSIIFGIAQEFNKIYRKNKNYYLIFQTFSKMKASKLKSLLTNQNFTIFAPKFQNDLEMFLLPIAAIEYAKMVSFSNILLIFDEHFIHRDYEINYYEQTNNLKWFDFIGELSQLTGSFEGKSITTIIGSDPIVKNNKLISYESLCDQIVSLNEFDPENPKISDIRNHNSNLKFFTQKKMNYSSLLSTTQNIFKQVIEVIHQSTYSHQMRKLLKICEEPWDNFPYYDSKYYEQLIFFKKNLNIEHQILFIYFISSEFLAGNISKYKDAKQFHALFNQFI